MLSVGVRAMDRNFLGDLSRWHVKDHVHVANLPRVASPPPYSGKTRHAPCLCGLSDAPWTEAFGTSYTYTYTYRGSRSTLTVARPHARKSMKTMEIHQNPMKTYANL